MSYALHHLSGSARQRLVDCNGRTAYSDMTVIESLEL